MSGFSFQRSTFDSRKGNSVVTMEIIISLITSYLKNTIRNAVYFNAVIPITVNDTSYQNLLIYQDSPPKRNICVGNTS